MNWLDSWLQATHTHPGERGWESSGMGGSWKLVTQSPEKRWNWVLNVRRKHGEHALRGQPDQDAPDAPLRDPRWRPPLHKECSLRGPCLSVSD